MEGLSPHVFAAKFVTKTHRVSGKKEPWTWERREEGGLREKKGANLRSMLSSIYTKDRNLFSRPPFSLALLPHPLLCEHLLLLLLSSCTNKTPFRRREREMDRKYLQTPLLLTRTMLPPPPPPPRSPWRCKGRGWGKRRIVL